MRLLVVALLGLASAGGIPGRDVLMDLSRWCERLRRGIGVDELRFTRLGDEHGEQPCGLLRAGIASHPMNDARLLMPALSCPIGSGGFGVQSALDRSRQHVGINECGMAVGQGLRSGPKRHLDHNQFLRSSGQDVP